MALTATEEALVRQLLDQQAAILSLAGNEATITSKLGATKVSLSDLLAASSVGDTDLFLTRQGTADKSVTALLLRNKLNTFLLPATGAVTRSMNDKASERISALDFGAKGDSNGTSGNGTDDVIAIQKGLDWLGANGGGTLFLPKVSGKYRITQGLKIPSFVCLEGECPSSFPYNGGNPSSSNLVADFANPLQWVIDTKTTVGGLPLAYNEFTTGLPDGATYNCSVRNLQINGVGTLPYGAVRMQGCPGATVDNVSAVDTATGLLVNGCWSGNFRFHARTPYYGVVIFGNTSANIFDLVCEHAMVGAVSPKVVPAQYLMPFMNALNGTMISNLKLSTEAHYNRAWGLLTVGDTSNLPNNNTFNLDIEQYSGGWFSNYSYGMTFNNFYFEGNTNEMDFAVVNAFSNWRANSFHAYLSGTGVLVDLGVSLNISWTPIGLKYAGAYGFGPYKDTSSLVTIDGVTPAAFGPTTPQFNLVYTSSGTNWTAPPLINGWTSIGGLFDAAGYRLNSRSGNVELQGGVTGGTGSAFVLPVGFRPLQRKQFKTVDGVIVADPDGNVYVYPDPTKTGALLYGVFFEAVL